MEELVGSPAMVVKWGCGKAMLDGVEDMILVHSGRNMMAEWRVLWHGGGGWI